MTILEFPELAWKEGERKLAIEISIDYLPQEYQGRWQHPILEFTANWVANKSFEKKGTVYMWGSMSCNYAMKHGVPSWSEFIIVFGLPAVFADALARSLTGTFRDQAGYREYVTARRDDGWSAFCHVEQGNVWTLVDADTWSPFGSASKTLKSVR